MTYDNWKTTNPDDAFLGEPTGECDCCGKQRVLSRCWAFGIETFACDECRGWPPEDDDEELRYRTETGDVG